MTDFRLCHSVIERKWSIYSWTSLTKLAAGAPAPKIFITSTGAPLFGTIVAGFYVTETPGPTMLSRGRRRIIPRSDRA